MTVIFFKNLLKCLPSTPISDPDRRLLPPPATAITTKNFNSLYDISSASTSKSLSTPSSYSFSPSDSDSDPDSPPDFAAAVASRRFFFSSPGRSNSIVDPPETPAKPDSQPPLPPLGGGIAVKKLSPDPYADFRDSMREMIEARNVRDVRSDWEYLQELLCCYLNLNPKHTHKVIISAFSDIVVCLLSSAPESGGSDGRRRV